MSQSIEVRLFAGAAAAAQQDQLSVPWDRQSQGTLTSAQLMQAIAAICPDLSSLLGSCRLAVDGQYVLPADTISADAEIALIPPVSGG